MKIKLIHELLEFQLPLLNLFEVLAVKLLGFVVRTDKLDARWSAKYLLLCLVLRP